MKLHARCGYVLPIAVFALVGCSSGGTTTIIESASNAPDGSAKSNPDLAQEICVRKQKDVCGAASCVLSDEDVEALSKCASETRAAMQCVLTLAPCVSSDRIKSDCAAERLGYETCWSKLLAPLRNGESCDSGATQCTPYVCACRNGPSGDVQSCSSGSCMKPEYFCERICKARGGWTGSATGGPS